MNNLNSISYPHIDNKGIKISPDIELLAINPRNINKLFNFVEQQSELGKHFINIDFLYDRSLKELFIAQFNQDSNYQLPFYLVEVNGVISGAIGCKYQSLQNKSVILDIIIDLENKELFEKVLDSFVVTYHQNFGINRFEYHLTDLQNEQKTPLLFIGFKLDGIRRDAVIFAEQTYDLYVYSYILPKDFMANIVSIKEEKQVDPYQESLI